MSAVLATTISIARLVAAYVPDGFAMNSLFPAAQVARSGLGQTVEPSASDRDAVQPTLKIVNRRPKEALAHIDNLKAMPGRPVVLQVGPTYPVRTTSA